VTLLVRPGGEEHWDALAWHPRRAGIKINTKLRDLFDFLLSFQAFKFAFRLLPVHLYCTLSSS